MPLPLIMAGAGVNMLGNWLGSRSARKAAQAAANTQAGQAGENAALAGELPYRLNPYLQQSAEQWSGNVRGVYDEAGNLVMDTAQGAAAGARGAAAGANEFLNPYLQTGQQANQSLYDLAMSKLNAPDEKFAFSEDDPSYQWRLQQGQQALERSAAGRGALSSGATLKALTNYAQGAASQEYAAAHKRWLDERGENRLNAQTYLNPLGDIARSGLAAGTNMGQNLLTGERMAGDWLTGGANQAGQFRGRGAEFQSTMMNNSTQQQMDNIMKGEYARMGYMTDRASALAGGTLGAGQAQANMWAGLGNAGGQGLTLGALMNGTGGQTVSGGNLGANGGISPADIYYQQYPYNWGQMPGPAPRVRGR